MRTATFILSLVLVAVMTLQSCAIYVGGGLVDALGDEPSNLGTSGVLGLFVAFSIAADYPDMNIHGVALIILAVMAFFSRRKPKPAVAG